MKRTARLMLPAALCASLLVTGAPSASAAVLESDGWWWRAQVGLLVELPPPSYVPEDGLYVAGAPDGPAAVAAVRFRLDEDELDPLLTLVVAEDRGGEAAPLQACINTDAWSPRRAGVWDDRPPHDCEEGSVDGVRADDGGTWTFALGDMVRGERVDVTILAGQLADGQGWAAFELAFEPIDHTSLTATPTFEAEPQPEDEGDQPSFTPGEDEGRSRTASPEESTDGNGAAGGSFDPPPAEGFSAEPFTPPPPETAAEPQEGEGTDVEDPMVADADAGADAEQETVATAPPPNGADPPASLGAADLPTASAGDERRSAKGLGLLLVALCAGVGMVLADEGRRPPQPLGRFGPAAPAVMDVRGIGRFARPRQGRPPRIV